MTPQEIFNKVWDHLNKQGKPAMGSEGECRYRAPDGSSCAIGCLVDDETAKLWDGAKNGTIRYIINKTEFEKPEWMVENRGLLIYLQHAHDANSGSTDWLADWRAEMAHIAANYNLTVPPIPDTNA